MPWWTKESARPYASAGLTVIVAMLAIGCAADENVLETYPVSGQVTYKGKPATGARVIFFFASGQMQEQVLPTPQATADEDGNFRVSCFGDEDGAPAGDYRIAIVWREDPSRKVRGDYRPPDRLKGRYGNPRRSGLTATVVEGKNILPTIQLN